MVFQHKLAFNPTDQDFVDEVLNDYRIAIESREASLLARKEVLTGKAKFGITGDGKELPQIAMAKAFQNGDWRAGYYRDQTFMFASGLSSLDDFFSQLYADTNNDPFSGGRQMNSHFATPTVNKKGEILALKETKNVSADTSCTAGQMSRALGLALASKKFKNIPALSQKPFDQLSENGNEVVFCTIGDGSTSEGIFWETVNAANVEKAPMMFCIWDDGYAISVPTSLQTTKSSISKAMSGMLVDENNDGMMIYVVNGWDYPQLCYTFQKAARLIRERQIPALVHVVELTQPQGHSTSGSHERYKSNERLSWEKKYDGIRQMRMWIVESGIATIHQLMKIEEIARETVKSAKLRAWKKMIDPINNEQKELIKIITKIAQTSPQRETVTHLLNDLRKQPIHYINELISRSKEILRKVKNDQTFERKELELWLQKQYDKIEDVYHSNLLSENKYSALSVKNILPIYDDQSESVNGSVVINAFFDKAFEKYPNVIAFGEDLGKLGDVNQGFVGLQEKYGVERIFDTGIREWTIVGQSIGLAQRGIRPIAEIQYLDYVYYGLTPMADDLSSLRFRSNGIQTAPAIIRTRGHRLEGIWHSGSPMGMLLNAIRGMYMCVPRNFVQAAGMYNTLLQSDDPAIVIECLNAYRQKELMPTNMGEYTVPLGQVEFLRYGRDITIVTYGACVKVALDAADLLTEHDIEVEVIDVQTLLPFDLAHAIKESVIKTNRVIFFDEDVPGGATAYMMQKVLEDQKVYKYLDSEPRTVTAKDHRTAFGSDGDYFGKPQAEDVFEAAYAMMHEYNPIKYPKMYFI